MAERRDSVAFEQRRFAALALHRDGVPQADIARQFRVSRAAVCQWLKRVQKRGPSALKRRPRPGRPPKLRARQRRSLVKLLARGADALGYATQLWTAERIRRLVWEHFGVRFHVHHVPKLLRQCGWSYQRPTGRATERDEREVQRWLRQEWPRIKKKPKGKRPR
jgi:transposase